MMARMAQNRVPRRSFLAAAGLIGGSAALAACTPGGSSSSAAPSGAARGQLPAAARWSDRGRAVHVQLVEYVDPANMEAFKAEFGVKNFVYDTFANNDELLAKLAGGASGYDFACPTAEYIPAMAEEGYIQKLDCQPDPQLRSTSTHVLSQGWDPNNEYHMPRTTGRPASCIAPRS